MSKPTSPAWKSDLAARARALGFGSLRILEVPGGTVLYDGMPGLLSAFSPHTFSMLEREAVLPGALRLVHQPGLRVEELFNEDSQGTVIRGDGL